MGRPRPQALDNLVFGLAILLFCVVGYYGFKQVRQRRETDQLRAARSADLPPSMADANSSAELDRLDEIPSSGARGVVSGTPAVGSDVGRR